MTANEMVQQVEAVLSAVEDAGLKPHEFQALLTDRLYDADEDTAPAVVRLPWNLQVAHLIELGYPMKRFIADIYDFHVP
jgi:murein L,D-transpeptidase YcbB/YkuD